MSRLAAALAGIELHGNGQVGRAFARRCTTAGIALQSIRDSQGIVHGTPQEGAILVDATPSRYGGEEAARRVAFFEERLERGIHVVTANKAPLALAWDRLERAARRGQATLACSATVGGGTPVLAWVRRVRQAHGITELQATLSGTLSFVLAAVAAGVSLPQAVRDAQARGFAEPDPRLDLDGTDARAKAVLLHNIAFDDHLRLDDAGPALDLDEASIRALSAANRPAAAVAHLRGGQIRLALAKTSEAPVPPGHVEVRARTSHGTWLAITGPGAGPEATAGALWADLNDIQTGRATRGIWP